MAKRSSGISVCALVPYPPDTTPSQRFRIEQWRPHLQADGISVDLLPFMDERLMKLLYQPGRLVWKAAGMAAACAHRVLDVLSAARYDVVFIHRAACIVGPALLERLLGWRRVPIVFDFDDAIYLLHTMPANRRFGWLKFPGKTATICRLSAHVVVCCNHLADYVRRYNPRVSVISSSIDTDLYRPVRRLGRRSPVVIGWSGSATSQEHLELFADALRTLTARRKDVVVHVQSNREPVLPGVRFVWHPWSRQTEVEVLSRFDIGIKPMPNDPWALGKGPMKEIQYMALGVPTVCSVPGSAQDVIRHGENGFLASTPEDWLAYLEALVDDPALRHRVGLAGRRTVEEGYSTRHCAARFGRALREALQG